MNRLRIDRQTQIIKVLCEGNSIRSTARITNTAINTVVKLLKDVGAACLEYQYQNMRNLHCTTLQCDEIWSYVYAKYKNIPEEHNGEFGYGDVWTFTAIDADTKLVPCWKVGTRDANCAYEFISDLKDRLADRVQLTTDGHRMYLEAIEQAFGRDIDYAMLWFRCMGKKPTVKSVTALLNASGLRNTLFRVNQIQRQSLQATWSARI